MAVADALAWSRRQIEVISAQQTAGRAHKEPTVRNAIAAYVKTRLQKNAQGGGDAERRLSLHVLSDPTIADMPLKKIRSATLEAWRDRLPSEDQDDGRTPLKPSTVNRLLNDFRAALNASAERHRRELPPYLAGEIKVGTRAISTETNARKQFLTEAEVQSLVDAAFAVDENGDFGRLVLLMAATGTRYSQAARVTVGDLQMEHGRVLVPHGRKGNKKGPAGHTAIPLSAPTLARLRPALEGRPVDEPLLLHWVSKQIGPVKWERDHRGPWKRGEIARPWNEAKAASDVPVETVPYALRHTSILRGLRANLPVRLLASLHDTSVAMIEAHYSAYIVDASEDLARRAMLTIAEAAPFAEAAE